MYTRFKLYCASTLLYTFSHTVSPHNQRRLWSPTGEVVLQLRAHESGALAGFHVEELCAHKNNDGDGERALGVYELTSSGGGNMSIIHAGKKRKEETHSNSRKLTDDFHGCVVDLDVHARLEVVRGDGTRANLHAAVEAAVFGQYKRYCSSSLLGTVAQ